MFKKLKSQVQEAVSTAAQLANTSMTNVTNFEVKITLWKYIRNTLNKNFIFV